MKPHTLAFIASGIALAPPYAAAADGTVTFTGELLPSTCKINGSDGAATINVPLPSTNASALANIGDTAGTTAFSLALSACRGTKARALFQAGTTIDPATGGLINQAASGSNVQVRVLNDLGQPINLATNANSQWTDLTGAAGAATGTLSYSAQYYAAYAAATAGPVSTSVTLLLDYR